MLSKLDGEGFQEAINTGTCLIKFGTNHCYPCKTLSGILKQFSQEAPEGLRIYEVNVDLSPALAPTLDILSVPCLMIFKDGTCVARKNGMTSLPALRDFVDSVMSV